MLVILVINMPYKLKLSKAVTIFVISHFLNADVGSQYNNL